MMDFAWGATLGMTHVARGYGPPRSHHRHGLAGNWRMLRRRAGSRPAASASSIAGSIVIHARATSGAGCMDVTQDRRGTAPHGA